MNGSDRALFVQQNALITKQIVVDLEINLININKLWKRTMQ